MPRGLTGSSAPPRGMIRLHERLKPSTRIPLISKRLLYDGRNSITVAVGAERLHQGNVLLVAHVAIGRLAPVGPVNDRTWTSAHVIPNGGSTGVDVDRALNCTTASQLGARVRQGGRQGMTYPGMKRRRIHAGSFWGRPFLVGAEVAGGGEEEGERTAKGAEFGVSPRSLRVHHAVLTSY
jgi:hypothetical protein